MAKFRKKPVVIDAVQWNGYNLDQVIELTGKHPKFDKWFSSWEEYRQHVYNDRSVVKIFTLEGVMEAHPGDWIIKGIAGECYPCKPGIFYDTYEAA